jgi:hypothetical protein
MTKTLNQIIFFSSTKIRIFFSATLGIRIFFCRFREHSTKYLHEYIVLMVQVLSVSGCTKLRSEIETQRTKRNETKYYATKYTKMRNEIY